MQDPTTILEIPATSMSTHEVTIECDGRRIVTSGVQVKISVREVTCMDLRRETLATARAPDEAAASRA